MISRDEQRKAGLLPPKNVVRAYSTDAHPLPSVAPNEPLGWLAAALGGAAHQPNRGTVQNDTAITQSWGWILSAAPFVGTVAIVVTASLFVFWIVKGTGGLADYAAAWLLLFGLGALLVLAYAHRTHMQHSPAGVELADIGRQRAESTDRTTVALAAISAQQQMVNRQLDYSQQRWLLEHGHSDRHRLTDGGSE